MEEELHAGEERGFGTLGALEDFADFFKWLLDILPLRSWSMNNEYRLDLGDESGQD